MAAGVQAGDHPVQSGINVTGGGLFLLELALRQVRIIMTYHAVSDYRKSYRIKSQHTVP
jgi:hypothetical protein